MENHGYVIESNWKRSFIPLWVGQIISLLGSGLVQFALVWYITQQTGSAAMLTTATLVAILPEVFLAPFAGALVDRMNRRLVMIVADGLTALTTLVLVFLFAFGHIQIWHIFVVLFLRSFGGIFQWPAMQASTALMVPEKHLSRFAGLNQAVRGGLNIIAPPLGALLMSLLPLYLVIAVDVVTAIIAILPLCFILIPQPIHEAPLEIVTPRSVLADVVEGFKYVRNWRGMLYLVLTAALLNFLFVPVGTLMPLVVTQYFHGDVWKLSLLESLLGIGIVLGGLTLGVWGGFKNRMKTSLTGIIGIGLGVFIFGIAPANFFWIAAVGMMVMGFMNPIANGPLQAIMQSRVEPQFQGRVMGMTNSICTMMMPIALLLATPIAELVGLRVWYWAGGSLAMVIGVLMFFNSEIINLEKARPAVQSISISPEQSINPTP